MSERPAAGTGGDRYVPYSERTGEQSPVYFTRDLSAEGLRKAFAKVNQNITGRVSIKLHTGEPHGPNIIPRPWVESLVKNDLPGAVDNRDQYLLRGRALHYRGAPQDP